MKSSDRIGSHGEFVFHALISRMCQEKFYFHPIHMGEKHPATDMIVELLGTTGLRSLFYVQVKSTMRGYAGTGIAERLRVKVRASDIDRLKRMPGPAYVAGIDIENGQGYLGGIVSSLDGAINGLTTRHPIDCQLIPKLWSEVDAFWNTNPRPMPMSMTAFGMRGEFHAPTHGPPPDRAKGEDPRHGPIHKSARPQGQRFPG